MTAIPEAFALEQTLRVPPAAVHACLSDLHQYAALHPLIESIEELTPHPDLPDARRYPVVGRIPVGPFRMRSVYVAAIDPLSAHEVHGHAWQKPGIRLLNVYELEAVSEGTRLVERCHVAAPWPLRGYVIRRARAAHVAMLRDLAALLEGRGP